MEYHEIFDPVDVELEDITDHTPNLMMLALRKPKETHGFPGIEPSFKSQASRISSASPAPVVPVVPRSQALTVLKSISGIPSANYFIMFFSHVFRKKY